MIALPGQKNPYVRLSITQKSFLTSLQCSKSRQMAEYICLHRTSFTSGCWKSNDRMSLTSSLLMLVCIEYINPLTHFAQFTEVHCIKQYVITQNLLLLTQQQLVGSISLSMYTKAGFQRKSKPRCISRYGLGIYFQTF